MTEGAWHPGGVHRHPAVLADRELHRLVGLSFSKVNLDGEIRAEWAEFVKRWVPKASNMVAEGEPDVRGHVESAIKALKDAIQAEKDGKLSDEEKARREVQKKINADKAHVDAVEKKIVRAVTDAFDGTVTPQRFMDLVAHVAKEMGKELPVVSSSEPELPPSGVSIPPPRRRTTLWLCASCSSSTGASRRSANWPTAPRRWSRRWMPPRWSRLPDRIGPRRAAGRGKSLPRCLSGACGTESPHARPWDERGRASGLSCHARRVPGGRMNNAQIERRSRSEPETRFRVEGPSRTGPSPAETAASRASEGRKGRVIERRSI